MANKKLIIGAAAVAAAAGIYLASKKGAPARAKIAETAGKLKDRAMSLMNKANNAVPSNA